MFVWRWKTERGEGERENEVTEKYRRELIKNRRSEQSNREERELGFDIGNRGMVFTLNFLSKKSRLSLFFDNHLTISSALYYHLSHHSTSWRFFLLFFLYKRYFTIFVVNYKKIIYILSFFNIILVKIVEFSSCIIFIFVLIK